MTILVKDIQHFSSSASQSEHYFLPEQKRLEGNPQQILTNHYSSGCRQFHVGIWQSAGGKWNVNYTEHEYCDILEGCSIICDTEGNSLTVAVGDKFVIPAGFIGTWEVIENCKKVYVIFEQK
ncbi:cupin domain-containing protein [Shewanella sp. JM162201]|uniref:Cupin domain-containing protein n=1 Tax=Shewanella jiangmenensis TaxID=2837387 RepID=A0ABS5V4M0_9GAMM|nr:cupin domain-containing protein [Shewanella jiangmenensis]MBT1444571.1 cupin domain-containing protein [Shewanella jiangmenensis]